MVIWPIAVLRDKRDAPSKEFVEDVLGQIDVSICKHLRSSDAFVSRLYSPDCEKFRCEGGIPSLLSMFVVRVATLTACPHGVFRFAQKLLPSRPL